MYSAATATVTISGASGAWSNNGGTFYPSTGTVIFTNAAATVSGVTDFYNVTINSGAVVTMGSGGTMRIGGTVTNSGTWRAAGLSGSTVEYNGESQTVLNPNGSTPGYDNLILSGSGTKTMPGTALTIGGNFSMSGTASATASSALTIGGTVTLGTGTTFIGGAYTHNVAGDWTNNGATVTLTGTTINLNGSGAQAIGGTATTAFDNLTISNTNAAVSANTNFSAGGTLTVNASAVLNPAAAVVISGGGTLTGNGTVNVTRTLATADFSSQYTISTKTLTNLTVAYVGSGAAQTVSALTYGGLKINNANGVTLGGNATVNGTLTLTSGKITTDANTVIIGSSGSVSSGSSSSYVYGNLQKYVGTGAQSPTFEVGTASYYNPVTVAFNNVSGAGNLTAKVTSGEHANIASSTIKSSKNVNAYWTFTNASITFDTYNATFTFVSNDLDSGANTGIFIVGRYSGGWTYPTIGARTSTSTQATGVDSLSDFAIGDSWESYREVGHTTVWGTEADPYSSTYYVAYMYGDGYTSGHTYAVGFYDNDGTKVGTDVSGSLVGTTLSCLLDLSTYSDSAAGTWHAVVFDTASGSPPITYALCSGAPGYVFEDDLKVGADAIPEFPAVISAIGVAIMCFAIYWWMRKRIAVSRQ